jgi:hypothetical protein
MTDNGRVFVGKNGILGLQDQVVEDLYIPEWQAWVRVASWSSATRFRVQRASLEQRDTVNLVALVATVSLVDESGKRLFRDDEIGALADKDARALDRIFTVATRLNAVTPEVLDALGKGSSATPSDASPSASPAPSG